jgi:hypothetical protein
MNFDSSKKITLFNIKEAQALQGFTKGLAKNTVPDASDNPAKAFINKLLERVQNIGSDAESVTDLLLKRFNVFTNLRLVLSDSEIIDYFQKFNDGADIPLEETLDLFALAYDANMKIGKNIREILEFILNHRSWNRNPALTKDIVDKTVSLATSTSTRFFPYFSMLLGVSDPGKRDLSSLQMISGLDIESQQAFREIANLAAKTDKDTLESIRIQQQAAQDALDVAKDKYSLSRGIVETLEKSSYDERLAKTILKLEQLFKARYSEPGYRKIKLMMFDLHFGKQIYNQLFADLNSSSDLRQKTRSSKENSRIAFTLDVYTADEIKAFNQEDFKDFDKFVLMFNNANTDQKNKINTIINNVKNDIKKLVLRPEEYKNNYSKIMDSYHASLAKLITKNRTSSKFSRIVLAAPPALPPGTPAPIAAAISALSAIPGVGAIISPLVSAINSVFSVVGSTFGSNINLAIKTITDGLTALTSFKGIIDIEKVINAISTNNVKDIQDELTKYMTGEAFDAANTDNFFKLLKLTALVNRDFTSVVTIMMVDALLKKNATLNGTRPLPFKRVTQEERENITKALQKAGIDKAIISAVIQLKDFRTQTLNSLNNQKDLADSFKSITISIPGGESAEAPLTGGDFVQSTQQYYNDLTKAIRMFKYEESIWKNLEQDAKPEQREALSVFLKSNFSEIKKDIQIVLKKLGEVYLLGIGNNAQVDVNIRKLEIENIVNKELFNSEKSLGVSAPLSGISLRENLVDQRAQYQKFLSESELELNYLKSGEAEARITGDYINAFKEVEKMIGKELINVNAKTEDIKAEIKTKIDALNLLIPKLNVKIINLTDEIVETSGGNRTSMSKFEKIITHSDENVMSIDSTENIKEADEVSEDYWNDLLPGFGSALEKPKKWRKKLTEDIPVKFNHTRKWTQ